MHVFAPCLIFVGSGVPRHCTGDHSNQDPSKLTKTYEFQFFYLLYLVLITLFARNSIPGRLVRKSQDRETIVGIHGQVY